MSIRPVPGTRAENFQFLSTEDPDHAVDTSPLLDEDGTLFLPASSATLATLTTSDGAEIISIKFALGRAGIHSPMAPATARLFAEAMIAEVDRIEAVAASHAKAAIQKARGK